MEPIYTFAERKTKKHIKERGERMDNKYSEEEITSLSSQVE